MVRFGNRAIGIAALAVTIAAGMIGAPAVLAQDATPTADTAAIGYPNHIHAGTCENLDQVAKAVLSNLVFPTTDDAAVATPVSGDVARAIPVAVASTVVPIPLTDIIDGGHAIIVRGDVDAAIDIACGNILGTPDPDGNLFIGLEEQDDSGLSGIAWLQDQGENTSVTIFLSDNNV